VHVEACPNLHRTLGMIHDLKVKAGVSLNPATSVNGLEEVLSDVDLVLVMTVNPGAGGQPFIEAMLPKINRLRQMLDERRLDVELEVDGGINAANAARVAQAGGQVLVAGSAVFNKKETVAQAVRRIRASVG